MLLKTLGRLGLQDATGVYTYQGVHGLLLLCYVVDRYCVQGRRQHNRELLADLLWPNSKSRKNRKNNLSGTLKRLREALVAGDVLRTCIDSDPYDPSLELRLEHLSLSPHDPPRLMTVDFTVCEAACAERDVLTVAGLYEGVFLAGIEKRTPSLAGELLTWLQDKRSSLASNILEACLDVLADATVAAEQQRAAQGLLERLSEHDPRVFIEPSLLADAHAYLPAVQQADLAVRLRQMLDAKLETPTASTHDHVNLLMTMALQVAPDFEVACRVQQPPLMGTQKAHCKQFLEDGDWLQSATQSTNTQLSNTQLSNTQSTNTQSLKAQLSIGTSPYKQPQVRLRGRAFWQRQAIATAQHVSLLQRLWQATPERPETLTGLFYLAWHYHQGVTPVSAANAARPQAGVSADATLEQLIRAHLDAISSEQAARLTRGMGNFAGFDWGKLTRVFLHRARQASRMERFAEVLAITTVWERARGQRGEAQNAQMVWLAAYALERQGDYGKATEQLTGYAEASDHHRALWASLLFRVGKTADARASAGQLLFSRDRWAQAEAHGLLAKIAYFAEDFDRAIDHYERAKSAWTQADEPCRAIGAEASMASCYDYRGKAGDVQRADEIYHDLAETIVRQGLPPLTGLRTRLNQLMLWDYHQLQTPAHIRAGFSELIDTLEKQDVSKEVLGKAWYNFGQHYYGHYQTYAENMDGAYVDIHHTDLHHARVCYMRALEALEGSRDRVTYACACGELGRVHQIQHHPSQAEALLYEAVDILADTNQSGLLAEYQALLAREEAMSA